MLTVCLCPRAFVLPTAECPEQCPAQNGPPGLIFREAGRTEGAGWVTATLGLSHRRDLSKVLGDQLWADKLHCPGSSRVCGL